jgi:hypothetical protein
MSPITVSEYLRTLRWNRLGMFHWRLRCDIPYISQLRLYCLSIKLSGTAGPHFKPQINVSKGCMWRSDRVCVNVNKCVKCVYTLSTNQTYFWSSLFWDVTRRRLVVYRRFGPTFKDPALRLNLLSTPRGIQKNEYLIYIAAETWNENIFLIAEVVKLVSYV